MDAVLVGDVFPANGHNWKCVKKRNDKTLWVSFNDICVYCMCNKDETPAYQRSVQKRTAEGLEEIKRNFEEFSNVNC